LEKEALFKKITILDFMSADLHLYLNTHPRDAEALTMYNTAAAEAQKTRVQFETEYGPLTGFRSMGKKGWQWEDGPWPWEESGNFALCGEGRF
jgi:spore coat protein JB